MIIPSLSPKSLATVFWPWIAASGKAFEGEHCRGSRARRGHCGLDVRPQKTGGASAAIVEAAALDAYSRLIHPSLENELRAELTAKAAEGAITVFGENLRQLLLQPPIRGKTVMGLDPGYRMGCKVAVVDPTGKVLDTNVVYPVPEFKRVDQAKKTIKEHGAEKRGGGHGHRQRHRRA